MIRDTTMTVIQIRNIHAIRLNCINTAALFDVATGQMQHLLQVLSDVMLCCVTTCNNHCLPSVLNARLFIVYTGSDTVCDLVYR